MTMRPFPSLFAALLLPALALSAPAQAAKRVALVIGNAVYAHAPQLANPLNDAGDIGAALGRLGFAVTKL
ncbi:MAG: caspase family protein, partial [Rhodospirillaceae bacterium]|nr:caspase family protein [Rhodospirillaceae bacterium]